MRYILLLYTSVALAVADQTTPSITAITNAALPALDQHVPVRLQPRSMATIWGKNLSPATASTAPPWVTSLGGIELHLVPLQVGCGTNSPPSNCDIVASLIFVSPTQINFLVPDVSPSAYRQQELELDAVIVENGQRFDSGVLLYVSPVGDFPVFQVGYDCDFSLSLVQPQSCGYSQTPGQNTLPLGAVTDLVGNQVTSQNPIHQGQVVTLWATGINSLSTDPNTGLLQQKKPSPITFGVTRSNANGSTSFTFNWRTQTPLWAGESPQYVGLSQINVAFPTCTGAVATAEERYNAAMTFAAHDYSGYAGNGSATLYMPFLVSPGEPTCQFGAGTTTTMTFLPGSCPPGENSCSTPIYGVTVSPSTATGTVTVLDGENVLLIANLLNGYASLPTNLTSGNHIIEAIYSGNSMFAGSSATTTALVPTLISTTTTLVSNVNPSLAGQTMTFVATVSPCCLPTGSVTFSFGNQTLCVGSLNQGKATCQAYGIQSYSGPGTSLSVGTYLVKATYGGDKAYTSSSSATVTEVVQQNPGKLSVSVWTYRGSTGAKEAALGEQVSLSAAIVSGAQNLPPTGTITLFDGSTSLGTFNVELGVADLTTFNFGLGAHTITASYSGDMNFGPASSSAVTITIWTISSFTSTPNPSTSGQAVALTVCGIPSNVTNGYVMFIVDGSPVDVRIASPCTSDSYNWSVSGAHSVKVGLVDIIGRSVPTVLFPVSITQTVK